MSGDARPDTWMPLYWGDYHKDTGHLDAAQHGFYLLLIGHYWSSGKPLPDDDRQLWRIARADSLAHWKKNRPTIAAFFQVTGGIWKHRRIDAELNAASTRKTKANDRAKHAASMRWASPKQCYEHAPSIENDMLEECPSPSPSPDVTPTESGVGIHERARARAPTQIPEHIESEWRKNAMPTLPQDWQPSAEHQAQARKHRPDLTAEELVQQTLKFRLHAASTGRRSRDWPSAWLRWMLDARKASGSVTGESFEERRVRKINEMLAEGERSP